MKDKAPKKYCLRCGYIKLRSEFYKRKKGKGDLDSWCKKCRKAKTKEVYVIRKKEGKIKEKHYSGNNKCIDCGKKITNNSTRCRSCSKKDNHNPNYGMKGKDSPTWQGGRVKIPAGYINIYRPQDPNSHKNGYKREHRVVLERYLGRYLKSEEVTHHINGKKDDNRLENLVAFDNPDDHKRFHKDPKSVDEENIIFDGRKYER